MKTLPFDYGSKGGKTFWMLNFIPKIHHQGPHVKSYYGNWKSTVLKNEKIKYLACPCISYLYAVIMRYDKCGITQKRNNIDFKDINNC